MNRAPAATGTITPELAILFSELVRLGAPHSMKVGEKTLAKKDKSNTQGNHRGIPITPTMGKTYEHVLKHKIGPLSQSGLQFGFSEGLHSQRVTLCPMEAIS